MTLRRREDEGLSSCRNEVSGMTLRRKTRIPKHKPKPLHLVLVLPRLLPLFFFLLLLLILLLNY